MYAKTSSVRLLLTFPVLRISLLCSVFASHTPVVTCVLFSCNRSPWAWFGIGDVPLSAAESLMWWLSAQLDPPFLSFSKPLPLFSEIAGALPSMFKYIYCSFLLQFIMHTLWYCKTGNTEMLSMNCFVTSPYMLSLLTVYSSGSMKNSNAICMGHGVTWNGMGSIMVWLHWEAWGMVLWQRGGRRNWWRAYTIPYHTIPYHTIPYHTIPYHTGHQGFASWYQGADAGCWNNSDSLSERYM